MIIMQILLAIECEISYSEDVLTVSFDDSDELPKQNKRSKVDFDAESYQIPECQIEFGISDMYSVIFDCFELEEGEFYLYERDLALHSSIPFVNIVATLKDASSVTVFSDGEFLFESDIISVSVPDPVPEPSPINKLNWRSLTIFLAVIFSILILLLLFSFLYHKKCSKKHSLPIQNTTGFEGGFVDSKRNPLKEINAQVFKRRTLKKEKTENMNYDVELSMEQIVSSRQIQQGLFEEIDAGEMMFVASKNWII
ncbi:Hypothetical_protein [Hexamita inflata]|uniref:Hypothetical_protein n=1 Tax=Hexamita inflata TaxID=28002 RepID=A0AA86UQJ3_9EUKA|nr:Hypothetical protein HINF_LOCUS51719 [Hexamita inflata]